MKSAGIKMSLLMGFSMSLCLSLVGNLSSGHFTVQGWLISFVISFAISMVIGLIVPMGKLTAALDRKLGLKPDSLPARLVNALVSDLIYTPFMTIAMVTLAWKQATAQGAQIPYVPMLLKSLPLSLAVGFVLSFVLMPLFMKLVMKGQPGRR